ncbi:MAG: haloacid dehalogenase [Anaerolineae bacterium]
MAALSEIFETIRADWEQRNALRDETLRRSRDLIRRCALSIRATHRWEWEEAERLLTEARNLAAEMIGALDGYADLYYTGYTQDALKELAEAHIVYAIVRGQPIPGPTELNVDFAAYLNGLGEAVGELRRYVLDLIRRGRVAEAEPYLDIMDEIYSHLVTVDFPDAITGGLRRTTDVVRSILERTRGDLTVAIRQDQMRAALAALEQRLGMASTEETPSDVEDALDPGQ